MCLNERRKRRQEIDEADRIAFLHKQRYGPPRLTIELNASGLVVSENTVARSMLRQSLVAKAGKKFKATTNSKHSLPVALNLLDQDFACTAHDQKWCGDITITNLWTEEGWLYLAIVMDLYFRRVIGWSMSSCMNRQLVCNAMQMAIDARCPTSNMIMHTDRGSKYCSNQFQHLLSEHGIKSSTSKKGDCYDNACAESCFHTLKVEAIHGERFETRTAKR